MRAEAAATESGNDIVERLKQWGDWQRSRSGSPSSGGLTGSYREREDHGQGLVIARDPQSEELDKLICAMGEQMGVFYQRAVVARYVWGSTNREIAELHRCSEALAKIRIQTAHAWLSGVVFGVRVRVIA